MDFLNNTIYWAFIISVGSYYLCLMFQKKIKVKILNPLLISTIFTIIFLSVFKIDYDEFYEKTNFLYYCLSPATVCLAIPLYCQYEKLKNNMIAIIIGISSGIIVCLYSILFFSYLFNFDHIKYISLLPKSITAAIAMSVSDELGGNPSLTIPVVIMTGIIGNIISEFVCKIFKITNPIARGVAIGSSSHIMGTAKAMEMGEIEGAISGLSVAITGIITVILVLLFSKLY